MTALGNNGHISPGRTGVRPPAPPPAAITQPAGPDPGQASVKVVVTTRC